MKVHLGHVSCLRVHACPLFPHAFFFSWPWNTLSRGWSWTWALDIHPESALWFYTVSVFRALCTSATNIVGLNWFANIVNKKQHYLLVTPCILLKLNHNAAIILFHWKEYAGPPRKIKRFYPLNPAEKIQHCNVACQVKSRSLCSAL